MVSIWLNFRRYVLVIHFKCYMPLLFILCLVIFSTCDNHVNDTQPDTDVQVEFTNLESFRVILYSDSSRQNTFVEIAANSIKTVSATPNNSGVLFYPTFFIDVPDIPDTRIPYNGQAIITVIEENKVNKVYIPQLENIAINTAYLKIINDSIYSLSLQQGGNEKVPLGGRPSIIASGQNAAYEISLGASSSYTVMRNTTIPIAFPASFTAFEKGNVYIFTYDGTGLVLTKTWPIPSPAWPAAPENVRAELLTADSSFASVRLSWNAVYNAESYRVYRAWPRNSSSYSQIAVTNTPSYTATNLFSNDLYYFKVYAVKDSKEGEQSRVASVRTIPAPGNVRITGRTNTSITIGWNTVSGVGYNIYRSNDENGPYTKVNTNLVTVNSYVDNLLSPETNYYYKIAAVIDNFQGLESAPVSSSTLSNVPGNLQVIAMTTSSVSLKWNIVNGASEYNIYRADNENGEYSMLNSVAINTNEYTDTGLVAYTMYYYKVSSIFSGIESELSDFVTGSAGVIVSGANLAAKLTWIKNNALSNSAYAIELASDENIAPQDLTYSGKSNITITIRGITMSNINLSASGSLFTIGSGVTLIVDNNVTLNGRTNNTDSLVRINNSGILIMNEGSKITGNITVSSSAAYGGGVYVNGGTFLMHGGKITGNNVSASGSGSRSAYGGGVYIYSGVFTMNDGEISGNNINASSTSTGYVAIALGAGVYIADGIFNMNGGEIFSNTATASSSYNTSIGGGGVYVTSGSVKFRMSGGVIYGNNAEGGLANTSTNGAALYCAAAGTAQYGTVTDNTFYRSGDLATSNTTIRVVDGDLLTE